MALFQGVEPDTTPKPVKAPVADPADVPIKPVKTPVELPEKKPSPEPEKPAAPEKPKPEPEKPAVPEKPAGMRRPTIFSHHRRAGTVMY